MEAICRLAYNSSRWEEGGKNIRLGNQQKTRVQVEATARAIYEQTVKDATDRDNLNASQKRFQNWLNAVNLLYAFD